MKHTLAVVAIVLAGSGAAAAQTPDTTPASAYYQFLLGRYLDSTGDLEGALAALQRAADLDPASAEIQADISGLLVRLSRPQEAIEAGERALANDPENVTANRVLGSIYASLAESGRASATARRRSAERAIGYLEKSDPDNSPNVQLLLGRMCVRAGQWDKGIDVLNTLLRDEPGVTEAVRLLAQAYDGAGRRDEAIGLLEGTAGDSTRLSQMLGQLYEQDQRWADAAEAYGRAAERRPRDMDLKVRMATALLNVGTTPSLERARDALREVAAADPSHVRGMYMLVQVERSLLDSEKAEAAARMLLSANPGSVWGEYALAQVLADREDHRGVIAVLEPVVADWEAGRTDSQGLNPIRVFEQLAQAHQDLQEYDRALELFERARAAVPGDVRLVGLEAQAYREAGQLDRGVALLDGFIRDNPQYAAAYVSLAELYVGAGMVTEALSVVDRAAGQLPDDSEVQFGVGDALERARHYPEAERLFRALLAKDANHVQALNSLGYMLAVQGVRLDESVDLITRALAIEPDNPAIVDSLGWAYYKLDKLDLAEQHLRRAAEGLATNSVVLDHLGDTLFKQGNLAEAISTWERALTGDGDMVERDEIRRKLEAARAQLVHQ